MFVSIWILSEDPSKWRIKSSTMYLSSYEVCDFYTTGLMIFREINRNVNLFVTAARNEDESLINRRHAIYYYTNAFDTLLLNSIKMDLIYL
jgi:hypothetical protein